MGKLPKLPSFLSKFSKRKKLLFNKKTLDWLLNEPNEGCGEKLVEEAQKILADKKKYNRKKLVRNLTVYRKNWKVALGEIERLEKENKRLEVQVKILKRD